MPAHPLTHPSAEVLQAFALGKLNDTSASVVMNHLDSCPDCCKQVAALSGDDFLDRLRQAHGRSHTPAPAKSLADATRAPKPSASQTRSPICRRHWLPTSSTRSCASWAAVAWASSTWPRTN